MDNSSYWPQTEVVTHSTLSWAHNFQEDSPFLLPSNSCDVTSFKSCYFPTWSQQFTEASASRSHSEAEKRRRDRINAQLSTLRKLIPTSEKMDKAALLRSVVEHVKDLKGRAKEISNGLNTPSDIDEVIIEEQDESSTNKDSIFLKVSLCCDDRPELFSELNRGLKNLKLTTMEANITSLGGRIRCIFVVQSINGVCINSLKQSLRVVLSRIATSPSTSNFRIKSKRQSSTRCGFNSYNASTQVSVSLDWLDLLWSSVLCAYASIRTHSMES
ncbi:transcription factor bHLH51-like isoform X1 [Lycium barbarum]|uniref:transcription factor bHLH51-like isoform X1 n=1 Tax=Lycium barbarum TaxID=112863 RepID=UPI00293F3F00|nr:transcription factor bHLH51-like isoform X1 [Lycium barbarum]